MGKNTKFEITIVADTNDADYVTSIKVISASDLEAIKPLITAIKKFKPYSTELETMEWTHDHNWPQGDGEFIPRKDLGEKSPREIYDFPEKVFEIFEDLLPYGEHGIHTIDSIEVTPFVKKVKLL